MMSSDHIDIVIPPWGGELLIEMLEYIDFNRLNDKWIMGYSDISVLLFATTLKTGIATAHGANLFDLRGEYSDETTAMWQPVLSTKAENLSFNTLLTIIKKNGSTIIQPLLYFI